MADGSGCERAPTRRGTEPQSSLKPCIRARLSPPTAPSCWRRWWGDAYRNHDRQHCGTRPSNTGCCARRTRALLPRRRRMAQVVPHTSCAPFAHDLLRTSAYCSRAGPPRAWWPPQGASSLPCCVRATRSAGIQGPSKRGTAMGGFDLVELCKGSALCNSLRPFHSRC